MPDRLVYCIYFTGFFYSALDLVAAAGFFEGDGCVCVGGGGTAPLISIKSVKKSVVGIGSRGGILRGRWCGGGGVPPP